MEIGSNSSLCVAKVNATDAGNYTCSIGHGETLQQYTVLLHITNGMLEIYFVVNFDFLKL
jgi:hypothetical protein